MNAQPRTDLGSLIPDVQEQQDLPNTSKELLNGLKFRGPRTDLEVYHLAYGTKKLRGCTYRRMKKRQKRVNDRKAQSLHTKTPDQNIARGQKQKWLGEIEKIIQSNNLKTTATTVQKTLRKGRRKKLIKKKKAIQAKISASSTVMKD